MKLQTVDQVESVLDEINEAYFDIPFDNSAYQNEQFVIAASITPARAYRSIGLRMSAKIRALQEAKYSRLKAQIDIDEVAQKIANGGLNEFEIRRENLDRLKASDAMVYIDKLINDALVEITVLYKHFKAFPKFTREQFEAGERQHFTERLSRQVHLNGAQQSILNMDTDMGVLLEYQKAVALVENIDSVTLSELQAQLPNLKENR